ncbi:MAG: hypothetical protein RBT76_02775 [candidate division Zixibacteria bacterium]|nr:hypothetical protein [candidate division Zixibacteria bacterium]
MKLLRALVLTLALVMVFLGAFTITAPTKVEAARCCWVMVCTTTPPIVCWEVCRPCPKL